MHVRSSPVLRQKLTEEPQEPLDSHMMSTLSPAVKTSPPLGYRTVIEHVEWTEPGSVRTSKPTVMKQEIDMIAHLL
jgi:hypothetical protein